MAEEGDSGECNGLGAKDDDNEREPDKDLDGNKDTKVVYITSQTTLAPNAGTSKDEGGSTMLIIIVVCAVVGLALLFGVLLIAYKMMAMKSKRPAQQMQQPGTFGGSVEPMDADSNVVVGRPVDGSNAAGATSGAPVQASGKKGSEENPIGSEP